jgi:hypothetical protein
VTTGRALSFYQGTFTGQVDSRCSTTCLGLSYLYFGTVNQGTTSADCWCGNSITYVTINSGLLSGTTGEAGEVRLTDAFLVEGVFADDWVRTRIIVICVMEEVCLEVYLVHVVMVRRARLPYSLVHSEI